MYDIFSDLGAVWGHQFGLEVPNYFAQGDEPTFETPSFRRSDAFSATAREVKAVRRSVGINELQNFGKYRVTGANARAWLDRIFAGRVPKPGRVSLSPMLSPRARIIGDFTLSCLSDTEFQITGSYGAQAIHMRWFLAHQDGVQIENLSDSRTGFQIAGPNARHVLEAACGRALDHIRFMDVTRLTVGAVDCIVQRLSYTGDLGFEIYCDAMQQRSLWWALWQAGQAHGMTPFGMRAMMSLRLDRFFGSWLSDFSPDYTPFETGLDRFIPFDRKPDFIGRDAYGAMMHAPPSRKLHAFIVDADDADVHGYEPIWYDGKVVGFCTSGGYSHHAEMSVALGFLPTGLAVPDLAVEIEILGQMRPARLTATPLLDPDRTALRA